MNAANTVAIGFKSMRSGLEMPAYMHDGDSGFDVRSTEEYLLGPMDRHTFMLGFALDIPDGYEIQVRPRSGLASRNGVVAMFGTVDRGYKGEIGVTLVNLSTEWYKVTVGERIAQLVVASTERAAICAVADVGTSERGTGGFGSTGKE